MCNRNKNTCINYSNIIKLKDIVKKEFQPIQKIKNKKL